MKTSVVLLVSALFLLAGADLPEGDKAALRTVDAIYVLVESLHKETIAVGLDKDRIRREVEIELRRAGIKVLSQEEYQKSKKIETPFLYVQVNAVRNNTRTQFAYCINMKLSDYGLLVRDRNILVPAVLWFYDFLGISGDRASAGVYDDVRSAASSFANDWLAANQK